MEDNVRNLALISYIKISKVRSKILVSLASEPKFPSQIVKKQKIDFSTVSKTLKTLVDKNIVVCYTPERKKGKLYGLTKIGKINENREGNIHDY
ncbi:MAG: winged helix-turn-helix domain-containing protein [Candidatus Hodarchaeales archaeon]